jgi:hypothetical protein
MLTPLTERQKILIVNNVVRACKNIDTLSMTGYRFINQACGFIAHYNLGGFREYYRDNDLAGDIRRNAYMNEWNNFRPGDRDYDYYMAKRDVYRRIMDQLRFL